MFLITKIWFFHKKSILNLITLKTLTKHYCKISQKSNNIKQNVKSVFKIWQFLLTKYKNIDKMIKQLNMESYSRGSRGHPAKVLGRATGARVQIPHSPPIKT